MIYYFFLSETVSSFVASFRFFQNTLLFRIDSSWDFDRTLLDWLLERLKCDLLRELLLEPLLLRRLCSSGIWGFRILVFSINCFTLSTQSRRSDNCSWRLGSGYTASSMWDGKYRALFSIYSCMLTKPIYFIRLSNGIGPGLKRDSPTFAVLLPFIFLATSVVVTDSKVKSHEAFGTWFWSWKTALNTWICR